MIDLSELMSDPDFTQAFILRRRTGGFANEGEFTQAAPVEMPLVGAIQPASPADIVRFQAEGERRQAIIRVWSATQMNTSDGQGQQPDEIVWRGSVYRVIECVPWADNGFWKVFAEAQ